MADQAGYTRLPNYIIEAMPQLGNGELRVILAIARKTIGYQKDADRISLSQIETMTGLTHRNAHAALKTLIGKGWVDQKQVGKQSYEYSIKPVPLGNQFDDQFPRGTSSLGEPEPVPVGNQFDSKPVPVGNTQKKDLKEKRKERERVQPHTPRPPTPVPKKQTTLSFAHEAVTSYQRLTGVKRAPPANADKIADTVIDLAHWEHVIKAWTGIGFRRDNVDGMLDWYLHPEKIRSEARNGRSIRQGAGKHFERATWTEDG